MTVSETCDDIADACGTARNFVANDPDATASITQQSSAEIGGQGRRYEAKPVQPDSDRGAMHRDTPPSQQVIADLVERQGRAHDQDALDPSPDPASFPCPRLP